MQKVSLGIAAVSIALFSNIVLSHRSIETQAQPEFHRLEEILKKIGDSNAKSIVQLALPNELYRGIYHMKSGRELSELALSERLRESRRGYFDEWWILHARDTRWRTSTLELITSAGDGVGSVRITFPSIVYQNPDPEWTKKTFKEAKNLDEIRSVWDTVVSTEAIFLYGRSGIYLHVANLKPIALKTVPPDIARLHYFRELLTIGDPIVTSTSDFSYVETDYDASAILTSPQIGHQQFQIFNLSRARPDLLFPRVAACRYVTVFPVESLLYKGAQLHVLWSTRAIDFAPWLQFNRDLTDKSDFAATFPNLVRLPDNYHKEPRISLSGLLQEKTQQSSEQIEVLGAKISSELIPILGMPALIILLFQFASVGFYLVSRVPRLEMEDASQWSFLLSGWPFFILSFGTIFLIPSAASIVSFISVGGDTIAPKWVTTVLAVIVIFCAAAAFFFLQRLRSLVLRNSAVQRKRGEA